MQLLTAEGRYKESCKNYRDTYYDTLRFINERFYYFIRSFPKGGICQIITLEEFKDDYRKFHEHFENPSCPDEDELFCQLDSKLNKLTEILDVSDANVFLHVMNWTVQSIYFESDMILHKIGAQTLREMMIDV